MNPRLARFLRFLRSLLVAGISAIAIWTVILMLLEEKFIYFPDRYPRGPYEDAQLVHTLRDCWIMTEDGVTLHGWFATVDSPLATLVISHGNAGNISHRLPIMRQLLHRGFNVLMFDYRGYGRSEGSPSEEGIYADGRAAFDYAAQLPSVDSGRIILWGTSLGSAVAVDLATHRPAAALILESAFPTARDVARTIYPFLPVGLVMRTQFDSQRKIRDVHVPALFIHGSNDSVIPLGLGQKLYRAANEPKEFYIVEGADHNDTFFVGGAAYFERITAFARSLPLQPSAASSLSHRTPDSRNTSD